MRPRARSILDSLAQVDHLLRGGPSTATAPARSWRLALLLVLAGCAYGAAMGTYGGIGPSRFLQMSYSAVKAPILLLATFGLSIPSFFVVNTLLGLRSDFAGAVRALIGGQAGLTVILASLAPFTLLSYVSGIDYGDAILFNAAMFAVASVSAQWILRRSYRPMIARNPRHRWMLRLWLLIYAFVGIQMGWILRPFIGHPLLPTHFFRHDAWSNAYIEVGRLICNSVR